MVVKNPGKGLLYVSGLLACLDIMLIYLRVKAILVRLRFSEPVSCIQASGIINPAPEYPERKILEWGIYQTLLIHQRFQLIDAEAS